MLRLARLLLPLAGSGCALLDATPPVAVLHSRLGFEMVWVPTTDQNAAPPSLYIMRTEVTQQLWSEVMGTNSATHNHCGPDCPVETLSWVDAVQFANALSRQDGLVECYLVYPRGRGSQSALAGWPTGTRCDGYRMPTTAEWTLAAQGGQPGHAHPWGDGAPTCDQAVMNDPEVGLGCGGQTAPVCSRPTGNNTLGLCDISGNVQEWVWDDDPASTHLPASKRPKMVRGGSWHDSAADQAIEARTLLSADTRSPTVGLRLVRSIPVLPWYRRLW